MERVHVECHAGYRGSQHPVAVLLDGGRVRVAAVVRAWIEPEGRFFRVRLEDGRVALLRHEPEGAVWDLVAFVG